MSVHVSSWAWKQNAGDAGAKLVLLKLADNANDQGLAWPSQARLARECEMSRATVQRKLEKLRDAELILPVEGGKDVGRATRYIVGEGAKVPQFEAPTCPQGASSFEVPGASSFEAPGASLVRHITVIEPSDECRQTAEPVFNIREAARAELVRLRGGSGGG